MISLFALWLPIIISAVVVFLVSSVLHMFSPWHKGDYPKVPNEEKVMDALRPLGIPPGDYMVPRPSGREDMNSPEFTEKLIKGPVLMMSVWPNGRTPIGKSLILWFLYSAVISLFAAYIASRALTLSGTFFSIFRFTGATAFIGYSAALWQMSIWYNRPWSTSIKITVDGLIYALLTAGVFGWLWPM